MRGIGKKLKQFSFGNHFAIEQMDLTLSVGGEAGIVGDHADGRALFVKLLQELHHGLAIL